MPINITRFSTNESKQIKYDINAIQQHITRSHPCLGAAAGTSGHVAMISATRPGSRGMAWFSDIGSPSRCWGGGVWVISCVKSLCASLSQ